MISFFNNRWEVYAGESQEELAQHLEDTLKQGGYSYTRKKLEPQVMYDASKEQILFNVEGSYNFLLIHVTADPVSRIFASLFGVKKRYQGVTLISAYPYKMYQNEITGLAQRLSMRLRKDPWEISHNVTFQFAFLLNKINKWKWKKCLSQKGV